MSGKADCVKPVCRTAKLAALRSAQGFPGNRPSVTNGLHKLTPGMLGKLIAL